MKLVNSLTGLLICFMFKTQNTNSCTCHLFQTHLTIYTKTTVHVLVLNTMHLTNNCVCCMLVRKVCTERSNGNLVPSNWLTYTVANSCIGQMGNPCWQSISATLLLYLGIQGRGHQLNPQSSSHQHKTTVTCFIAVNADIGKWDHCGSLTLFHMIRVFKNPRLPNMPTI